MNVSENYVIMLIQLESEINIFQFYCGCSEITLEYFRSHAHFICSKGHKTEKEQWWVWSYLLFIILHLFGMFRMIVIKKIQIYSASQQPSEVVLIVSNLQMRKQRHRDVNCLALWPFVATHQIKSRVRKKEKIRRKQTNKKALFPSSLALLVTGLYPPDRKFETWILYIHIIFH